MFLTRHVNRVIGEVLDPELTRLRTELANAQTRDPALLSGRAAWRQRPCRPVTALPPAGDACAELRAWVRDGAPRSEAREATAEVLAVDLVWAAASSSAR